MTKQPKYGMGVEPTLNHLVTSSKQILPPYMQSFRCRDILPVAKKECLIRIINYPKEKVQPKYVSKLCFYVKLTIDRILLICIMQFFCSSKHTLPKNSRIYIFVSYLPIMSVPNFYFLSIIFSCVFADNTQPPWRNWLARSAVNRKVGGSSPPGGGETFENSLSVTFSLIFIANNTWISGVRTDKRKIFFQKPITAKCLP